MRAWEAEGGSKKFQAQLWGPRKTVSFGEREPLFHTFHEDTEANRHRGPLKTRYAKGVGVAASDMGSGYFESG